MLHCIKGVTHACCIISKCYQGVTHTWHIISKWCIAYYIISRYYIYMLHCISRCYACVLHCIQVLRSILYYIKMLHIHDALYQNATHAWCIISKWHIAYYIISKCYTCRLPYIKVVHGILCCYIKMLNMHATLYQSATQHIILCITQFTIGSDGALGEQGIWECITELLSRARKHPAIVACRDGGGGGGSESWH